jgi:two-component sensor histidine kinase
LGSERPSQRGTVNVDREADHRIANNLGLIISLLRLRARAVSQQPGPMDRAEVGSILEDIAARVETVAQLHRMLSHSYRNARVDIGNYLRELSLSLTNALAGPRQMEIVLPQAETCLVPPDQVLTLGLLVSELVSNSVKYAHPAGLPVKIDISCIQNGGRLVIDVADDGVGLPEGFNPQVDGGLGLRLVRSMAAQLNATILFDSGDLGTRVTLVLPVPSEEAA